MLALVALAVFVLPFAFPTPPPIITRFHATQFFSPDGDGRRDIARISVRVRDPSDILIEVRQGEELVTTLVDRRRVAPGWLRVAWDGRDAEGRVVPDGTYALKLRAHSGRKQFNTSRRIVVDGRDPTITRLSVASLGLLPSDRRSGPGECRLQVASNQDGTLVVEVLPERGTTVRRRVGPRPTRADVPVGWTWKGDANGEPVPPGLYRLRAVVTDSAGNRTERAATCWVGHAAGRAIRKGANGRRLGVALEHLSGAPLPASTPVELTLRRRVGTPGEPTGPVLGTAVGSAVRGRLGTVSIPLPRGADPETLWLLASTADAEALVDPEGP